MFKSAAGTAPMQPSKARKPRKKWPLSIKIFIALVLGILVGLCFMKNPGFATRYIQPFGTIFLNLIKFVVVPIVFFSIISGVISLSDIREVAEIGVRTRWVRYKNENRSLKEEPNVQICRRDCPDAAVQSP
ncbi:cation:dicarboxylate symporter family transporter [Pseudoramibacter alactolyticus]